MDWYFYGPLIPRYLFQGQRDPGEVIAASFATGYCGFGSQGYESGILISEHQLGRGRFLLNTIPILENVDAHPAADRLLLNLVRYAAGSHLELEPRVRSTSNRHSLPRASETSVGEMLIALRWSTAGW